MGGLPGVVCLLGVGVMLWAFVLPFLATPCAGCFQGGGQPLVYVTWSLAQGSDARLVALTTLCLVVLAASHLLGLRRSVTGAACLAVSVGAVGLVVFEGVDAGSRIFPATEWAMVKAVSPALTLDAGFYVFLFGALIAMVGGFSMVLISARGPHPATKAALLEGSAGAPPAAEH